MLSVLRDADDREQATRPQHPSNLGEDPIGIPDEMQDVHGEAGVHGPGAQRQGRRVGADDPAGQTLVGMREHGSGQVDADHGPAPLGEGARDQPGAHADLQQPFPGQPRTDRLGDEPPPLLAAPGGIVPVGDAVEAHGI